MIDAGIIGEDEKFELIDGEIVMSAAKGLAHERIKSALTIAVARALPNHLTMGVETTLRLTNTIMLEPDIAVFPKDLFKKSSARFAQLDSGALLVGLLPAENGGLEFEPPRVESGGHHSVSDVGRILPVMAERRRRVFRRRGGPFFRSAAKILKRNRARLSLALAGRRGAGAIYRTRWKATARIDRGAFPSRFAALYKGA